MSEKTTTTKKKGGKPTYIAYQVRDRGEGQKGFFTRIGGCAVWVESAYTPSAGPTNRVRAST